MDLSEVRKLLPFYVAGTLSNTEKQAIEEALQASDELRDELRFWRKAKLPAEAYSVEHPSAETILDYIEGRLIESERGRVDVHVGECLDCQSEIMLVRETYQSKASHQEQRLQPVLLDDAEKLRTFVAPFTSRLALTLTVVGVIFCVAVVFLFWKNRETVPPVTEQPPTQMQRHVELVLEYSPQVRSAQRSQRPRLDLSGFDVVDCIILVPYSIDSVRYSVSLVSPGGVMAKIQDSLRPIRREESVDRIQISITRNRFTEQGEYRVVVTEQLPSVSGLPPESHVYSFVVAFPG